MPTKKPENKGVQNGPRNSLPKDFIPNTDTAPDNSFFFDDTFDPLSSKGNSILADDN